MVDRTTEAGPSDRVAETPEYGSSYYQNYWGGGGPYERNERWLEFFDGVAEAIVRELHPSSVLDAGCAMGFLVEALRKRGVDARGMDISEYAISQVHESVREHCSVASLGQPIKGRFDLITCIEVVEHIPPAETEKTLANLCNATDRLLLSTTPRDFSEPTHLNVQPPEWWTAALANQGFLRAVDRDMSFLSPWAGLFERTEEPLSETVRRYDRVWWRQREEIAEVRASLLANNERISELELRNDNRSELELQLDQSREEVLRLRDHLIAQDAELGLARGQLVQLEDQWQRVSGALIRAQNRIPAPMRMIGSALRRLSRQRR